MNLQPTKLAGVLLIQAPIFSDERGYFMETFQKKTFFEHTGRNIDFVQDSESLSSYGILRGLHFQLAPYAQAKLIRVVHGKILDVIVDIQPTSKTFGQHIRIELDSDNKQQVFIPRGYAHGFVVLSKEALISYKMDNYYNPKYERGILFSDPALAIDWQLDSKQLHISERDQHYPLLKEHLKQTGQL